MAEILMVGSRGEEVRRLQSNLNAAIGKRYGNLAPDGKFGPLTKKAVERFQRDFKLKKVDGIVGPETRNALATRTLLIHGTITRTEPAPAPPPTPTPPQPKPPPNPPAPASRFLLQFQPAFGLTPPPFFSSPSGATPPGTTIAGQVAIGIVYRTETEGPHWEFGLAFQPSFNSRSQPSDPRYTLQLQGSASYADPWSYKRIHTALFGQVVLLQNLDPATLVLGGQIGGQVSVDIIDDRWSLFIQGALAGQWTLHDSSGGPAGQLQFGPQFTILGTTIQWGL